MRNVLNCQKPGILYIGVVGNMGMYSSFVEQDIKFRPPYRDAWAELSNALVALKSKYSELEGWASELGDCIVISPNMPEINFVEWDEWKIEGYWYKEMVAFLVDIAKYIEGYVEFEYEGGYRFRIVFEKGKGFTQRPENVNWKKVKKVDLI